MPSPRRLLLQFLLCISAVQAQNTRHLTILHSNDLHAHLLPDDSGIGGFAYLAAAVRAERAHCDACLYLNAGDLVQGTPVSTIYRGVPIYEIGNRMGFDAAVLGNHEFDYGWRLIQRFARIANYPLLAANVLDGQSKPITGKPYVILRAGGIRVAVIGVLLGDLNRGFEMPELLGPVRVLPVTDAVRRCVREVRDKSDLIVVLGHIHDSEAEAVLRDVSDVSVVVVGHSHIQYPEPKTVDGRVAVLVNGYAAQLGRLELDFDLDSRKIHVTDWKKIAIDSKRIAPAPDVAREVARWEAKVSRIVDVKIGESKQRLDHNQVRSLIERIMIDETGADFAFMNSGGVRDTLPAGTILARNIWNILPFDNVLVVGSFKGRELPASVTRGQAVDPERDYQLVTTDFTAANQESKDELNSHGLRFPVAGPLLRGAVIEWIRKRKQID